MSVLDHSTVVAFLQLAGLIGTVYLLRWARPWRLVSQWWRSRG